MNFNFIEKIKFNKIKKLTNLNFFKIKNIQTRFNEIFKL